jgi:hypothetical protein
MNESSTAFARLADQARRHIQEISPHELARAKPLPIIIDVREPEEYVDGYVARAKHLSRGVLEQKIAEMVPDFPLHLSYIAIEVNVPRWRQKT